MSTITHRTRILFALLILVAGLAPVVYAATAAKSGFVSIKFGASEEIGASTNRAAIIPHTLNYEQSFSNGTGSGAANLVFTSNVALTSGNSTTHDLTALTDSSGATINMAKVKVICVYNTSTTAAIIEVGGAAANAYTGFLKDATDIVQVHPGGAACWSDNDGIATSGTSKNLKVLSNGATSTGTISILGTDA